MFRRGSGACKHQRRTEVRGVTWPCAEGSDERPRPPPMCPATTALSHEVRWSEEGDESTPGEHRAGRGIPEIEISPQRGYGDPVIKGRGVTTSIIRELVQAGEPIESIAESYELEHSQIEAALRFELRRAS